MKALLITLFSLFPYVSWALDCVPPAPAVDIRLYVGSIYDLDDPIVPGQELSTVETCAIGNVASAATEQQWQEVQVAWQTYETAVLKPPSMTSLTFPDVKVESFNIGKIAFVTLGRNYRDYSEAAVSIADILSYADLREITQGAGTVKRYDILQWSPDQVSDRMVLVYDDGQILSAEVNAWREACRSLTFTMTQIEEAEYPDYRLAVTGIEDVCSITIKELALAQPRE